MGDADAVAAMKAQGIEQEGQAGFAGLVGEYLGIGEARVVIDRQVQVFPALAALFSAARIALSGSVAGNVEAYALDSAQFPDVDVDHLAGGVPFGADDLELGVKRG